MFFFNSRAKLVWCHRSKKLKTFFIAIEMLPTIYCHNSDSNMFLVLLIDRLVLYNVLINIYKRFFYLEVLFERINFALISKPRFCFAA